MMETSAFGFGVTEIVLLLFGGQFLGLAPGERDPLLIKSPPAHAYAYMEWTAPGRGTPGAPGLEGFVADPEIQEFVAALTKSLNEGELSSEWPALLTLVARHAGACYLANSGSDRDDSRFPALEGAIVLSLGDDAPEFLARLGRISGGNPAADTGRISISLTGKPWQVHQEGSRVILTTGAGTLGRLQARWQQPNAELPQQPDFQRAWRQSPVQKFGSVSWINLTNLTRDLQVQFGLPGFLAGGVVRSLGLSSVGPILTVSGTDDADQLRRTQISIAGEYGGLLRLAAGRPLTEADFAHIPADADFVAASSLNLGTLKETLQDLFARTLPRLVGSVDEFQRQLDLELRIQLDDILLGFGDAWTIHSSPSNGGIGLVAAVPVRDLARAQRLVQRIESLLIEGLSADAHLTGRKLESLPFLGNTISYVAVSEDAPGTSSLISPAFCLTEGHLLVALHPQALKSQLRFEQSREPRFDAVARLKFSPDTGELLTGVYLDSPRVVGMIYPLTPFVMKAALSEWRADGVNLNLGSLPSPRAVLPYVQPLSIAVTRRADGLWIEQRNTLPIVVAALLWPHLKSGLNGLSSPDAGVVLEGANGGPSVDLGSPEGGVVQAKVEEPPKPGSTDPNAKPNDPTAVEKAARRTLPFMLRSLIPTEAQPFIPADAFDKVGEPPDPEAAAQRAAERQRRREERARMRAIRRGTP